MKVRLIALACGILLAVGLPLAASAGPTPGGTDTDGDTVEDAFDNCTLVMNDGQGDIDHDGCGDACDKGPITADNTGDNVVGAPDFITMSAQWNGPGSADVTGDGVVGTPDFIILSGEWNNSIGPSGITNAMRDLVECPL